MLFTHNMIVSYVLQNLANTKSAHLVVVPCVMCDVPHGVIVYTRCERSVQLYKLPCTVRLLMDII